MHFEKPGIPSKINNPKNKIKISFNLPLKNLKISTILILHIGFNKNNNFANQVNQNNHFSDYSLEAQINQKLISFKADIRLDESTFTKKELNYLFTLDDINKFRSFEPPSLFVYKK